LLRFVLIKALLLLIYTKMLQKASDVAYPPPSLASSSYCAVGAGCRVLRRSGQARMPML
jgi:hypothetical protein